MRFTSQTTSDGVSERLFTLDDITGVLWSPAGAIGGRPLVLLGHGGGQHKKAPGLVARAHRYVRACGFAVAAIDAPGHGDRPKSEQDERFTATVRERMAAGEPIGPYIARHNAALAARAVPEWRATLDALRELDHIGTGGPVGFWGVSMGSAIGVPLAAADHRITAAVFGLAGDETLAEAAARVTVPVEFLLQWDDELVPRAAGLALFEAFGSREKTLHANPGRHVEVPAFELDGSARFFSRHLADADRRLATPHFTAHDGTDLAYHVFGEGAPVVCLPTPMQDSAYLGELGGLSEHRRLIMLDPRGTGESAIPDDVASYRADRLVDDVEALREHLGLDRLDLLAHCGGANLAALYAARYPDRVGKLALITPSTRAVGIEVTGEARLEVARLRKEEPWFEAAFEALEAIVAGNPTDDGWKAIEPFMYGRWDAAAQAHQAAQDGRQNAEAATAYGAEGVFDPRAVREALAELDAPVLLLAGETDLNTVPGVVVEYAALFPDAELVVQPKSGHFPWLDAPDRFVAATATFLG